MIKFFRKIRQQLLTENKFSKYLLYAIGEIVLVVIGILIALSINNWNEEKQRVNEEKSLLTKLVYSVQSNMEYLERSRDTDREVIKSINKLIYTLENDLPYNDSIGFHFHNSINGNAATFSTSALETIRSRGIDIIKSDSIRDMVLNLFDMTYTNIEDMYQADQSSFFNNEVSIYMKNFRMKDGIAIPKDYELLLNNFEILSLLEWRLEIRHFSLAGKEEGIEKSKGLIKRINEYLNLADKQK